jgi:hypothetical protein
MATKLIELADHTLVEVEVPEDQAQQISGGLAQKVTASLDNLQPTLVNISRVITAAWKEVNQEIHVEGAEVTLGLSFEGQGNIYVTKSTLGANLAIKLVLRPKESHGN